MRSTRGTAVKAGLATAGFGLAWFVVAHILFLTPYLWSRHDGPLWQIPVGLLGPLVIGIPLALIAGPAVGLAWHEIRLVRGRLAGWHFGALFAAFIVPFFVIGAGLGPLDEEAFRGAAPMFMASVTAAFLTGFALGGWRGALGLVASAGLVSVAMGGFMLQEPLVGWPGAFVLAAMAGFVMCGPTMERLHARFRRSSQEVVAAPQAVEVQPYR